MVRDSRRRLEKFEHNVDPETLRTQTRALKPSMVKAQGQYFPKIATVEQKIKALVEKEGIPTIQVRDYLNYGRELYELTQKFSSTTLNSEAQTRVDKWVSRDLDGSILAKVASLFGLSPSYPPKPPTIRFLDDLEDVEIDSPTDEQLLTYEEATSLWKNKDKPQGMIQHANEWHDPDMALATHNHNLADLAEKSHSSLTGVTPAQHHASARDISYYRKRRVTGAECYYSTPTTCYGTSTALSYTNFLYVVPFPTPRQLTIDQMCVEVTTSVALARARLGIYNDDGTVNPTTLLLDAGEVDASSTGNKFLTVNQVLNATSLYWLGILANKDIRVRALSRPGVINILGRTPGQTEYLTQIYAAQTYGPLPATFPTPYTLALGLDPHAITVRISALE